MPRLAGPFWLCHECHAEMRPIQREGVPHCASCDGEFIENLYPEVNPPASPLAEESDHSGFFQTMFSSLLSAAEPSRPERATAAPRGREFAFNFPGGGRGSVVFGSMGQAQGSQGLDAFFPGFASPQGNPDPGRDMLGGLFQMLAQEGNLPPGMASTGAIGDYVMTENGFDQVMEQLMHAAGPQGPLPATEAVIEGLPRFTFDKEGLESSTFKDCPVCKDDYVPGDEVMKVPCAHIFHPDCLQPWLKTNGSCPVCRFSLVPDEANRPESEPQPALTNILNRLWGQGGATPMSQTPPTSQTPDTSTDPPVPDLSSAIPDDYRERHRRRERQREEEYPSYFS